MGKNELVIYEGAMCCTTGVCGPEPDQELIVFNETVKKLQNLYSGRLNIIRASLVFNSVYFFANKDVVKMLKEYGQEVLPITAFNGQIISRQKYPAYGELKKILDERIGR